MISNATDGRNLRNKQFPSLATVSTDKPLHWLTLIPYHMAISLNMLAVNNREVCFFCAIADCNVDCTVGAFPCHLAAVCVTTTFTSTQWQNGKAEVCVCVCSCVRIVLISEWFYRLWNVTWYSERRNRFRVAENKALVEYFDLNEMMGGSRILYRVILNN
jgi:hypothetical protein